MSDANASEPVLSVIVLQWDEEHLTRRCVDSIRDGTTVSYELIIVDNGSASPGKAYARAAADVPVLNGSNLGFAGGMNAGLAKARGSFVAFVNNDTVLPQGWDVRLLQHFDRREGVGIAAPVVSNARPHLAEGDREVVLPFSQPPSAVLWVMRTAVVRELGGFDERYWPASAEDLDLAFCVWVNDLDVIVDHSVVIGHVGKGTAATKLPSWRTTWRQNGDTFLTRWTDPGRRKPRLSSCAPDRHARNVTVAASAATWMKKYYAQRKRRFPGRKVVERVCAELVRLFRKVQGRGSTRGAARGLDHTVEVSAATLARAAPPSAPKGRDRPPVFVCGTGRSGTTVLSRLIGASDAYAAATFELKLHTDEGGLPTLFAVSENGGDLGAALSTFTELVMDRWFRRPSARRPSGLFQVIDEASLTDALSTFTAAFPEDPRRSAAALIDTIMTRVVAVGGGEGWVEMTPASAYHAPLLKSLCPDARFVHVYRDGRDVAASIVRRRWGPDTPLAALEYWANGLRTAHASLRQIPADDVLEVDFGRLVRTDRRHSLETLTQFLDLQQAGPVGTFFRNELTPRNAHIGRWLRAVPSDQHRAFGLRYAILQKELREEGLNCVPD